VYRHEELLAAAFDERGLTPGDDVVVALHDSGGPGPDGTIWGGEILAGSVERLARRGLLFPVRVPGGQRTPPEPWRMACAWLLESADAETPAIPPALVPVVDAGDWLAAAEMARSGYYSPLATSAGLWLDAIDALTGAAPRPRRSEAATAALDAGQPAYSMPMIAEGDAPLILDARPTVRSVVEDLEAGRDPAAVRADAALTLADATALAVAVAAEGAGIDVAILVGDVFDERSLRERTAERIAAAGVRVLEPRRS
jgi:hydrogenase maturation protein HypF